MLQKSQNDNFHQMGRPKLKIQNDRFYYLFETISIIGLICLIIIPFVFYGKLPETMPKHFDIHGNPDAYGSKGMVWFLPILGIVLYAVLTILCKYPHTFNFPTQVTQQNAGKLYKKGIIIIHLVKLTIVSLFVYLNLKMIEIGLGQLDKLSGLFLPIILIVFLGMTVFAIIWMRR